VNKRRYSTLTSLLTSINGLVQVAQRSLKVVDSTLGQVSPGPGVGHGGHGGQDQDGDKLVHVVGRINKGID
jgi:hypothetical protein